MRDVYFKARVTEYERRLFHEAAEAAGRPSASEWAREVLRLEAERVLGTGPKAKRRAR